MPQSLVMSLVIGYVIGLVGCFGLIRFYEIVIPREPIAWGLSAVFASMMQVVAWPLAFILYGTTVGAAGFLKFRVFDLKSIITFPMTFGLCLLLLEGLFAPPVVIVLGFSWISSSWREPWRRPWMDWLAALVLQLVGAACVAVWWVAMNHTARAD